MFLICLIKKTIEFLVNYDFKKNKKKKVFFSNCEPKFFFSFSDKRIHESVMEKEISASNYLQNNNLNVDNIYTVWRWICQTPVCVYK